MIFKMQVIWNSTKIVIFHFNPWLFQKTNLWLLIEIQLIDESDQCNVINQAIGVANHYQVEIRMRYQLGYRMPLGAVRPIVANLEKIVVNFLFEFMREKD